jgi:hypothetical protein
MAKLSAAERVELVGVAEMLHATLGQETAEGVRIERVWGRNAIGVRYVDPANPAEPIKEMSATAYAAEFYKLCGGDLNTADFDTVIGRCAYIGNLMSNRAVDITGFDTLKVLAGGEVTALVLLDDGDYR